MNGHGLKMLRKRAGLSQKQAAREVYTDVRTWQRYEASAGDDVPADAIAAMELAIKEAVALASSERAARDPRSVTGKPVPEDEAGRVAFARQTQRQYLETFESIPQKFGKEAPHAWAVEFWNAGVLRWPIIQFGPGGMTPCPAAFRAALQVATNIAGTGLLQRVFAQLDDCPEYIKTSEAAALPDIQEPEIV